MKKIIFACLTLSAFVFAKDLKIDVCRGNNCYTYTVADAKDYKYSGRGVWSLDLSEDPSLAAQFKTWMEKIFLKGVPQTLTVFEYEDVGTETDFDCRIKKFCNLPSD